MKMIIMNLLKQSKLLAVIAAASIILLACGDGTAASGENAKTFKRFFVWGQLKDEDCARQAKAIGVTDITVNWNNPAEAALARKYDIKAYARFTPQGVRLQKITAEELLLQKRLNGEDIPIPKNARPEEKAVLKNKRAEFRKASNTQFGGEPVNSDVLMERLPCFAGEDALEKSKALLSKICKSDGIDGIAFDYIGYVNFKGCYCENCLKLYMKYISENKLADDEKTRNAFYLKQIVDYNNSMIDYIKKLRPEFKIMAHLYPVFQPEPLYGNRLKVDYCGQTAAWYFLWTPEKIRAYSAIISGEQNKYFKGVAGVAFIGYYDTTHWPEFPYKSPERVELELKAILDGGSESLMLCSLNDVIANPQIAVIFKKYCAGKQ
jgi:hypothetical protein